MELRSRAWHYKYRPNLSHHGMAQYHAGIHLHFPDIWTAVPGLSSLTGKAAAAAAAARTGAHELVSSAHSHTQDRGDDSYVSTAMVSGAGPESRRRLRFIRSCMAGSQ